MNNSSLKTPKPIAKLSDKQIIETALKDAYHHHLLRYIAIARPRPNVIADLTPEQIEAAYRYREFEYRVQDAENHVDDLVPEIDKGYLTEDDYLHIAEYFLDHYDCNIDENTQWIWAIEKCFEDFSEY